MHVLVLDTIHGGKEIGAAYREAGHSVDVVDVYHGTTPDELREAQHRHYDLIVAPVHLDPDHPLLAHRTVPVIIPSRGSAPAARGTPAVPDDRDHRGAGKDDNCTRARPCPLRERCPAYLNGDLSRTRQNTCSDKKSITPASVIAAVRYANRMPGWLVAEISLGVTGAGDLAIITSPENYPFAGGKKCAIHEKIASTRHAKRVLVAEGVFSDQENVVHVNEVARCDGMQCTVELEGMKCILTNPLFLLPPYRAPLMLAAAAAMMLHISPTPLNNFTALPGRMSLSHEKDLIIIDNANSGTNVTTTLCAARYARHCARVRDLTLVIGQVEGDGAVCEGFSIDQITCRDRQGPAHPRGLDRPLSRTGHRPVRGAQREG